jgi:dTDP-3-amino-2,3,6-trideoxy-4-keto-D-glucose/dTDP-3-amino-3,4,6-trideoxy-alpha-D-glucose/dTDP-2,6-dideoxy-D-kanosamine transaminase
MPPDTRVPSNALRRGWIADSIEVREAVERVLAGGWYVHGPEHAAFETELAQFLGVRHAAGVASGTDALCLAMLAVGCGAESEIVTAANAGGYSSCAAMQIGARTVYSDVDPATMLVTAETLAQAIGPQTTAVVVTHLYGNIADVEPIVELCRPRGIHVIEDCAQAIGGIDRKGRKAGSIGDIATFSFYPTKNLGAAGDAGAVVTNSDGIDARVRSLRQYGWSKKYLVAESGGRNSRLDEIQAAILRIGLRRVDELNERRRAIVRRYAEATRGSDVSPVTGAGCETVAHLAVVRCRERDEFRHFLGEAGIDTDVHYPIPDDHQPGLKPPARSTGLLETERATAEIVTLPCFPEMTDVEIDRVAAAIAAFSADGAQ